MASRIEQIIDEIEDYIDGCKTQAFAPSKIIVNRETMEELLNELRSKTPDEIKRYQKIIANKDAILADAQQKAESMIEEAHAQTSELVSEHEIMQQAYAQANEVVTMASKQAQEILEVLKLQHGQIQQQNDGEAATEAQHNRFGGERSSGEMSEPCPQGEAKGMERGMTMGGMSL
mgnify:CR=1 FL=1